MPSVMLVRQKGISSLKSDGLYPSFRTGLGLTVAVATYTMSGDMAIPEILLHLFPYQDMLLVPVPEDNLPIGVLIKSESGMWGLPTYIEGEPLCEEGPRDPNGEGIFPFISAVSQAFLTHKMSASGMGRPIMTTSAGEGFAIAEALSQGDANYARNLRGRIDIWRRSPEQQMRLDNKRGEQSGLISAPLMRAGQTSTSGDTAAQTFKSFSPEGEQVALGLGDGERVRVSVHDEVSFAADAVCLPIIRMVPQFFVADLIQKLYPQASRDIMWTSPTTPNWYSRPSISCVPVAAAVPSLGRRREPSPTVFGTSAAICNGTRSCPHCFPNIYPKRG